MQDIPEPLPLFVVDHRAHVGICPQCNRDTKASFLEGVGSWVQYGLHLTGLVLYRNTHQLIPVKRRKEYTLLLRLRDHGVSVLLFTRNPQVPATNNMAELAVRMEKVSARPKKRGKIGIGLLRKTTTVLATAHKQGWNRLETLRTAPEDIVERLVVDIPVHAPG